MSATSHLLLDERTLSEGLVISDDEQAVRIGHDDEKIKHDNVAHADTDTVHEAAYQFSRAIDVNIPDSHVQLAKVGEVFRPCLNPFLNLKEPHLKKFVSVPRPFLHTNYERTLQPSRRSLLTRIPPVLIFLAERLPSGHGFTTAVMRASSACLQRPSRTQKVPKPHPHPALESC